MNVARLICLVALWLGLTLARGPPASFDLENIPRITSYYPLNHALQSVATPDARSWEDMEKLCAESYPGYTIAAELDQLTDDQMELCPEGELVPAGVLGDDAAFVYKNNEPSMDSWFAGLQLPWTSEPDTTDTNNPTDPGLTAFLWPHTERVAVDNATTYQCAICQLQRRKDIFTHVVYPQHDNAAYAYDLQMVSYHKVEDVANVAADSALVTRLIGDLAAALEVGVESLRWQGAALDAKGKATVHVFYQPGVGDDMDWPPYLNWGDPEFVYDEVDNFQLILIKLNTECLERKKIRKSVTKGPILTGSVKITKLKLGTMDVTTRECYWDDNPAVQSAVWSPDFVWATDWETCNIATENFFDVETLEGHELTIALQTVDIEMVYFANALVSNSPPSFIAAIVMLANEILKAHVKDDSAGQLLLHATPWMLAQIFVRGLDDGQSSKLVDTSHIKVMVAGLEPSNPCVGLAVTVGDDPSMEQLFYANMTASHATSHVVVTVADSISFAADRLAIAVYAAHLDTLDSPYFDSSMGSWMAFVQVTFQRRADAAWPGDDFVDVAFAPAFRQAALRGKCAERLYVTDEWSDDNCRMLKSPRDGKMVCRCKQLPYPNGDVTSVTYLIYGHDASLATYLATHTTLIIVFVVVCFVSLLGLLSVVFTAVCFPDWTKDQGHRIFLQMVLALVVNLALGFCNNFVSTDTQGVPCVVIGVLRHYSFLAMFCWMMILSGLQLKRLMTIVGSKATTHLILKVSLLAWSLPLVPVAILLVWDTGFYKSEVSNRGYCYPEGGAFQATVQAPVGLILAGNCVSFFMILNHIYGWCRCSADVVVRKTNTNDRATQLRKLSHSIFIFFLFGFTWVFHFLSEEGIINSEFLFEFLFLITAAFHLFMLSLFFIVLDKKTRKLWVEAFAKYRCRRRDGGVGQVSRPAVRRRR